MLFLMGNGFPRVWVRKKNKFPILYKLTCTKKAIAKMEDLAYMLMVLMNCSTHQIYTKQTCALITISENAHWVATADMLTASTNSELRHKTIFHLKKEN